LDGKRTIKPVKIQGDITEEMKINEGSPDSVIQNAEAIEILVQNPKFEISESK